MSDLHDVAFAQKAAADADAERKVAMRIFMRVSEAVSVAEDVMLILAEAKGLQSGSLFGRVHARMAQFRNTFEDVKSDLRQAEDRHHRALDELHKLLEEQFT